jgi:hypothetical protein
MQLHAMSAVRVSRPLNEANETVREGNEEDGKGEEGSPIEEEEEEDLSIQS